MAIQIRRTGAKEYGQYVKALICGDPGAGKTLISSTFPNPFYASAEGGLMSIADRNIPYADVRSLDDLLAIKNTLDQTPDVREQLLGFPVDTLIIDTIDEIQRIVIRERLEEQKKETLQLQDWGWLGEQMQAIIRGLRNLEMNVVMTCHLKETSDSETGKLYFKPQMQGAIGDQIPAFVDLALLLRSRSETVTINNEAKRRTVRFLQTYPDAQHPWIKDRSGKLPSEMEVDFSTDYKRIAEALFGSIEGLTDGATREVEVPSAKESVPEIPKPNGPALRQPPAQREPITPNPAEVLETAGAAEETPLSANTEEETPGVAPDPNVAQASEQPMLAEQTSGITCEKCKGQVESQDQADLSRIRFRKQLCRSCFVDLKRK